jgi:surface protein
MNQAFYGCTYLTMNATDIPNVSNVSTYFRAFASCTNFNADISGWDMSNAENMQEMFFRASSFNQDLSAWNVSSVTNMKLMFYFASSFDQNLGDWDLTNLSLAERAFGYSGLSIDSYDATLAGWADNVNTPNNVEFKNQNGLVYCDAANGRDLLVAKGWNITFDKQIESYPNCDPNSFITTWETTGASESITIPTGAETYDYGVDWGDGTITAGHTAAATHTYATAGIYNVKISGTFPYIFFNRTGDRDKIKTIEQWGTGAWSSMSGAFYGCSNLTMNATDIPNVSNVISYYSAFANCYNFNGDLSGWDMSNVENFQGMFYRAPAFAQQMYWKLQDQFNKGNLTGEQMLMLDKELKGLTDTLGACERIRKTPIPYSYSLFLKKFIFAYTITMPFGMASDFKYWTVPIVTFILYVFSSIELLAEEIENPFGDDTNDLPTDDIAVTIKNNVHEIFETSRPN